MSGILYPILILTLFLIVQILTMMASRKAILDKNKQQLLDSVNLSNKIYSNEELSILLGEQSELIQQQQNQILSLKTELSTVRTEGKVEEVFDNNNGYCWKFSNGMMICRNKFSVTLPTSNAWGSWYYFKINNVWNYAVPFASSTLHAYCNVDDTALTLATASLSSSSTGIQTLELIRAASNGSGYTITLSCMALGKWK